MEPVYLQQLRTLKGSTNRGIVIGWPLQGRSRQLGGCPFPRVENPWLFTVRPSGALAIRAGTGACPYSNGLAHCRPVPTMSSKRLWDIHRSINLAPFSNHLPPR